MPVPLSPPALMPSNLLVRSVNWLGDAVMTTPALQRLHERFPQARVTLLTSAKLAELWRHHPGIERVVTFSSKDNLWSVGRRLRHEGFDAALVLPNSTRSALEVWLARVPHRVGYAGNWRSGLLTRPVPYPADRVRLRRRGVSEIKRLIDSGRPAPNSRYVHQMQDYLDLAATLGANPDPLPPRLELRPGEVESAIASSLVPIDPARGRSPETVWLGLVPAAAYGPAKCWPIERFAAVTREVCRQVPQAVWLCLGAGADEAICQELTERSGPGMINLAGKTSLRQLMGLLKSCRVLLTNDSGPMHVAAALGTPVVVPFGSTSPELTGPGLPGDARHQLLRHRVPCSPCFRRTCPIDFRCMTAISPEQVTGAVLNCLRLTLSS